MLGRALSSNPTPAAQFVPEESLMHRRRIQYLMARFDRRRA